MRESSAVERRRAPSKQKNSSSKQKNRGAEIAHEKTNLHAVPPEESADVRVELCRRGILRMGPHDGGNAAVAAHRVDPRHVPLIDDVTSDAHQIADRSGKQQTVRVSSHEDEPAHEILADGVRIAICDVRRADLRFVDVAPKDRNVHRGELAAFPWMRTLRQHGDHVGRVRPRVVATRRGERVGRCGGRHAQHALQHRKGPGIVKYVRGGESNCEQDSRKM